MVIFLGCGDARGDVVLELDGDFVELELGLLLLDELCFLVVFGLLTTSWG
jgi:hypothetical protein